MQGVCNQPNRHSRQGVRQADVQEVLQQHEEEEHVPKLGGGWHGVHRRNGK